MFIEVHSTKKKLTKTLIKQMQQGENLSILNNCEEVLGYILNAVKGSFKSVIIKSKGDYYTLSTNWIKGDSAIYRKIDGTKYSTKINFTKKETLNLFWDKLQEILCKAKNHIYL